MKYFFPAILLPAAESFKKVFVKQLQVLVNRLVKFALEKVW